MLLLDYLGLRNKTVKAISNNEAAAIGIPDRYPGRPARNQHLVVPDELVLFLQRYRKILSAAGKNPEANRTDAMHLNKTLSKFAGGLPKRSSGEQKPKAD